MLTTSQGSKEKWFLVIGNKYMYRLSCQASDFVFSLAPWAGSWQVFCQWNKKLRLDKGKQNLRAAGLKDKWKSNFFHLEDCHPLVVGLCNWKKQTEKNIKFAFSNVMYTVNFLSPDFWCTVLKIHIVSGNKMKSTVSFGPFHTNKVS